MSENLRPGSAKIYQFPRKLPLDGQRRATPPEDASRREPAVGIEYGGAWYHDAALHEADRQRK